MTRKNRRKRMPSGICKVKSVKALRALLQRHRIDYGSWGTGYTKTPQQLMKEIRSGESVLIVKRGVLVRQVRHAQANISCLIDGVPHRLVEVRQEFSNGTVRHRKGADRSISEKIRANESPRDAMIRGIYEELGIADFAGIGLVRDSRRPRKRRSDSAESYPNLAVEHVEFLFTWSMLALWVRPEGYVEVQKRKTTHFAWKPEPLTASV